MREKHKMNEGSGYILIPALNSSFHQVAPQLRFPAASLNAEPLSLPGSGKFLRPSFLVRPAEEGWQPVTAGGTEKPEQKREGRRDGEGQETDTFTEEPETEAEPHGHKRPFRLWEQLLGARPLAAGLRDATPGQGGSVDTD